MPAPIVTRILVSGRVQGVGYRAWLAEEGRRLGLSGWVRNRLDGKVEALVAGDADLVDALVRACRTGPAYARVDEVVRSAADEIPSDGFHIRPTV